MKRTVKIYHDQFDGKPRVNLGTIAHDDFSAEFEQSLFDRFGRDECLTYMGRNPQTWPAELSELMYACKRSYDAWGCRERGDVPLRTMKVDEETASIIAAELSKARYSEVCDLQVSL